jgi:hypothetical protein
MALDRLKSYFTLVLVSPSQNVAGTRNLVFAAVSSAANISRIYPSLEGAREGVFSSARLASTIRAPPNYFVTLRSLHNASRQAIRIRQGHIAGAPQCR